MAAALECWSSRTSTDEDMVEQVLMRTQDRSESSPDNNPPSSSSSTAASAEALRDSSTFQKRFERLSRNVSEAIASLKNSLNPDSAREPSMTSQSNGRRQVWGSVVRSLTQLYPGSQLPEKLVSNLRKHYDSLPLSYSQAGFEMKDVFLHIKLIEQASAEDRPAMMIQETIPDEEVSGSVLKLTFACNSAFSWPAMSGALDSSSICCKKLQIFEKKGFTLGIVFLLVQNGQEKMFNFRIENALKSALKKPKNNIIKLPFGLCGCQEEGSSNRDLGEIDEDSSGGPNFRNGGENSGSRFHLSVPLPKDSILVSVSEWQTVISGKNELGKWLLDYDAVEIGDQIGPSTYKGVYKSKKVGIEKLKGCDKGNAYDFEMRRDLLELMACGHKNILQFFGVCVDENLGLCIVTKLMDGGSVHELIMKKKKLQVKDILRIVTDVAEAIKFMNDHGIAYRDLNTQRILLDKNWNACLGDMGIVVACGRAAEVMDYETDGYRWLAPEIIAGDPENVTETWMSNAYSFGMIIWEMLAGEIAYSACSPVQAAVGIAACGLRPEIPNSCPRLLRSLMIKCWNNCPSKRPQFSEIISTLTRSSNKITGAAI